MLNKYVYLLALLCFNSCKTGESSSINKNNLALVNTSSKNRNVELIMIKHSTWDRESTLVISYKTEFIHNNLPKIEDYLFKDTSTIGFEAMNLIEDYIYANQKDSVKGNLDGGQCFVEVSMSSKLYKATFYMQPKTDNNFLGRLIDTLQVSKFEKECILITSVLKEFNDVNKKCKGN